MSKKIRILLVDDQQVVLNVLKSRLSEIDRLEVVGVARSGEEALEKAIALNPDVITLDIEMPGLSGLETLRLLMKKSFFPVIIVSSYSREGQDITLECLEAGAVDFVPKPSTKEGGVEAMIKRLEMKIYVASIAGINMRQKANVSETAARAKIAIPSKRPAASSTAPSSIKLIGIGASTGGPAVIKQIVEQFPDKMPPTVISQHMPLEFTERFARRLNELSQINIKEAAPNDKLKPGCAYIAPGDSHLVVKKSGGELFIELDNSQKVNGHRPSVDVMFNSIAAAQPGNSAIGVLLTGMGKDGAVGLLNMHEGGAHTLAQSEESCVVFGMPGEAIELQAAASILNPEQITRELIHLAGL